MAQASEASATRWMERAARRVERARGTPDERLWDVQLLGAVAQRPDLPETARQTASHTLASIVRDEGPLAGHATAELAPVAEPEHVDVLLAGLDVDDTKSEARIRDQLTDAHKRRDLVVDEVEHLQDTVSQDSSRRSALEAELARIDEEIAQHEEHLAERARKRWALVGLAQVVPHLDEDEAIEVLARVARAQPSPWSHAVLDAEEDPLALAAALRRVEPKHAEPLVGALDRRLARVRSARSDLDPAAARKITETLLDVAIEPTDAAADALARHLPLVTWVELAQRDREWEWLLLELQLRAPFEDYRRHPEAGDALWLEVEGLGPTIDPARTHGTDSVEQAATTHRERALQPPADLASGDLDGFWVATFEIWAEEAADWLPDGPLGDPDVPIETRDAVAHAARVLIQPVDPDRSDVAEDALRAELLLRLEERSLDAAGLDLLWPGIEEEPRPVVRAAEEALRVEPSEVVATVWVAGCEELFRLADESCRDSAVRIARAQDEPSVPGPMLGFAQTHAPELLIRMVAAGEPDAHELEVLASIPVDELRDFERRDLTERLYAHLASEDDAHSLLAVRLLTAMHDEPDWGGWGTVRSRILDRWRGLQRVMP